MWQSEGMAHIVIMYFLVCNGSRCKSCLLLALTPVPSTQKPLYLILGPFSSGCIGNPITRGLCRHRSYPIWPLTSLRMLSSDRPEVMQQCGTHWRCACAMYWDAVDCNWRHSSPPHDSWSQNPVEPHQYRRPKFYYLNFISKWSSTVSNPFYV